MEITSERWTNVVGITGYEVSDLGNFRTYRPKNGRGNLLNEPRELRAKSIKNKPYLRVSFTNDEGVQVYKKAHVVVLESFIGPKPTPEHQTRHLDGKHTNNKLSNLVWGTPQENSDDKQIHNTQLRGITNPLVVLTEEQVLEVKAAIPYWKRGMAVEFATKFGVAHSTILSIVKGKTWSHL